MRSILTNRYLRTSAQTALLLVLGAGCSDSGSTAPSPGPDQVVIRGFAFDPTPRTVAAGTRITWTNRDDANHTVTADPGQEAWDSGAMETDGTFSRTFDTPGTYRYSCSIHPTMHGTVVVN